MYNDYDDEYFEYYTSSTFDNRTRTYLIDRYTPNASWDYGDTFYITFHLYDHDNTDEIEELEGKDVLITFYNDRYEVVPVTLECVRSGNYNEDIVIHMDYNSSIEFFKRGTYHCSVSLVEYDEEGTCIYNNVVLPMNDCYFYVN